MLTAKKNRLFENIFAVYNRNLFRRRFNSIRSFGLNSLNRREENLPLIIYANHSSWWDGLVAFEISRAAKLDAYVMMEEKQLKKLFPFRYLGAFSVVRENAREAVKSINYAAKLLREKSDRTVWIFPQGRILPNDVRPLVFYNGVSRIIEKVEQCSVVPVAFRYKFSGEFKPDVFVRTGSPQIIEITGRTNSKELTARFESEMTVLLDTLKSEVAKTDLTDYHPLF